MPRFVDAKFEQKRELPQPDDPGVASECHLISSRSTKLSRALVNATHSLCKRSDELATCPSRCAHLDRPFDSLEHCFVLLGCMIGTYTRQRQGTEKCQDPPRVVAQLVFFFLVRATEISKSIK